LAAGTYDYLITYLLPGGTGTATDTGTFTVASTTIAVTNAPAASSNTVFAPTITQTLDRWGNVLTVSDPRNTGWVTS
jgi:hypothetical protein